MKYSFLDFITLVGSLGFFLYGMKLMSEALQKNVSEAIEEFNH